MNSPEPARAVAGRKVNTMVRELNWLTMTNDELLSQMRQGSKRAEDELRRRDGRSPVKRVGIIDLTPTWRGVLPILIAALEDGTPEGKRLAKLELANMAKAADAYNASVPK